MIDKLWAGIQFILRKTIDILWFCLFYGLGHAVGSYLGGKLGAFIGGRAYERWIGQLGVMDGVFQPILNSELAQQLSSYTAPIGGFLGVKAGDTLLNTSSKGVLYLYEKTRDSFFLMSDMSLVFFGAWEEVRNDISDQPPSPEKKLEGWKPPLNQDRVS